MLMSKPADYGSSISQTHAIVVAIVLDRVFEGDPDTPAITRKPQR